MRKDKRAEDLIEILLTGPNNEELFIVSPLHNDNGELTFEAANKETGYRQLVTFKIEELH